MKYIWIIYILPLLIYAKDMTPMEHETLHSYNHKSMLKSRVEQNAYKLQKIDEEEAKSIALKELREDIESLTLTHHKKRLYYIVKSKNSTIYIDVLDGSIITPKELEIGVVNE